MKNNPTDSGARLAAASLAIHRERPQEAEQLGLNQPQDDPDLLSNAQQGRVHRPIRKVHPF